MRVTINKCSFSDSDKIPAIKAWRQVTGDGLRESKEHVESLLAGTPVAVDISADGVAQLKSLGFTYDLSTSPHLAKLKMIAMDALSDDETGLAEDLLYVYNKYTLVEAHFPMAALRAGPTGAASREDSIEF